MRDLRQLGDGRLLVDKLLLVQVSEAAAVESHAEVRPKHPLWTWRDEEEEEEEEEEKEEEEKN